MVRFPNWVHLDLKGANPTASGLLRWVEWLADAGFTGIVFEYEHMRRWRTLPETFRNGYDESEWAAILARCAERELEVVPLTQTIGHLEWMLRYGRYAGLREDGLVDELCPSNPKALRLMEQWVDEVIDTHPGIRFIHLGGDEVWQLGRCPSCAARSGPDREHLIDLYLEHMGPLIERALARGVTPMIWADMFWPESRQDDAKRLPEGVILVDWQYGWLGPHELTPGLLAGGHPVWAATGVRVAYDMTQVLAPLRRITQNLDIWERQRRKGNLPGVIHTCWARSSSFRPLYGPLEAWLPLLLYAANPEKAKKHPLFALIDQMDLAVCSDLLADIEKASICDRLRELEHTLEHEFERRCCAWWNLAIEYADCRRRALGALAHVRTQEVVECCTHPDAHVRNLIAAGRETAAEGIRSWQDRASALWTSWELTGHDEFFASRSGVLLDLLDDANSRVNARGRP